MDIKDIFTLYDARSPLRYQQLPSSVFQADMGGGNVLLDEDLQLVGVLDFNLSGRETALNMLFRESFVNFEDDEKNMLYDGQLQEKAFTLFIENLQIIKNITRSTRRKQTPRRCSTAICALSGGIRSGP